MLSYNTQDDSDIQAFTDATVRIRTLKQYPSDNEMLLLYALYKQTTVGNNYTDSPGLLDFKGNAKWNAWHNQKGKRKTDARLEYITLVDHIMSKYS